MTQTLTTRKNEGFISRNFKPPLVGIVKKYHAARVDGATRKEAFSAVSKEATTQVMKLVAALAINRLTARYLGVGSWDPKMQGAERMVTDASPVSMAVSTAIASAIPPYYADPLLAAEFAISAIRILVEQRAFRAVGITPDPAGVLLTPYTAGVLECVWKAMDLAKGYPDDPARKMLIAVNGIFGNVVRMVEAGVIIGFVKVTEKLSTLRLPPA